MPLDAYTRVLRSKGMLRLVSHDALAGILDQVAEDDPNFLPAVLAETINRAWLFGGGPEGYACANRFYGAWRQHGLSSVAANALLDWCDGQRNSRSFDVAAVWPENGPLPQIRTLLLELVEFWQYADGLLTFANDDSDTLIAPAVALPFQFTFADSFERRPACALDGRHERGTLELDHCVSVAFRISQDAGWNLAGHPRLHFATLKGPCDVPLGGASSCLPILAAIFYRSRGRRLPVMEIGFSGELAPHGSLLACDRGASVWHKKHEVLAALGLRTVIFPGDWEVNQPVINSLEELEARGLPLPHFGKIADVGDQVDRIQKSMRYGGMRADQARLELQPLLEGPLAMPNPRAQAIRPGALLALATAECHLGNPREARRLCNDVIDATGDKIALLQGLAQVRLAVIETDWMRYEIASQLCLKALDLANQFSRFLHHECDELDLRMQAEGTRGQALMFRALLPGQDSVKVEALECFGRALTLARRLDHDPDSRPFFRADLDAPRNAAYVFHWHALHEPKSAEKSWAEAWAASEFCPKTRAHVLRIAQLARYRLLLRQGKPVELPWWDDSTCQLPDAREGGGWVRFTAAKYRGAWLAATGRIEAADRDFTEAIRLSDFNEPLMRFIGGTAALQAGESLLCVEPDRAHTFLERAVKIFKAYGDWFQGPLSALSWLRRAEALLENGRAILSPQLQYPY